MATEPAAARTTPTLRRDAQTAMYRRWQAFFQDWDVILTPSITISPRLWRELYPAEIDRNMAKWQGIVQRLFRR